MSERCGVLLVLAVVGVGKCQSLSFWNFFVGPSLRGEDPSPKSTDRIVQGFGYRLDTHFVVSETGHILTLHRIPAGHKSRNGTKHVALIHHGLFGCSDMWLLRGPQHDLPYLLADAGYDVWLYNTRGNVYSRKHNFLDPDKDPQYWNFGIEEMGFYDLPASIDYILNVTNQKKLFFLGHSIGSTAGFIAVTMRPEYNKKIQHFVALGPLTYVKHKLNAMHKIIFSLSSTFMDMVKSHNIYEVLPRRTYMSKIIRLLCEDGSYLQPFCLSVVFSIVGDDKQQFSTGDFPNFVQYYPSGTSLKVMTDVIRYYLKGDFARSGSVYDLSKVVAPVTVFYGAGDFLVTKEDVEDLATKVGNLAGVFKIPYFNHLDFVLAKEAKDLLYNNLIRVMNKHV